VTTDIPIRCSCGALRGTVRGAGPANGSRAVCYCDDCQSFAHFLGRAAEILDPLGGTDLYQTAPARVEIVEGARHLACMRLTGRGLLRWYARCCNTPLGNTMPNDQIPFVGLIHSCMDHDGVGQARDETLGPVRSRVHGRFARGDAASLGAHPDAPLAVMVRIAGTLLLRRLRGQHRPTPFFDTVTGRPVAAAHILDAGELETVEQARDAWSGSMSGLGAAD